MTAYYQIEAYESSVLDLYHKALEGYSLDEIRAACTAHIKKSKWFPKISEILELIPQNKPKMLESVAVLQAHHVIAMVRMNGLNNPPSWEDPTTNLLMNTRWTWAEVCDLQESKNTWFVKEFVEAYNARIEAGLPGLVTIGGYDGLKQLASGLFEGVEK